MTGNSRRIDDLGRIVIPIEVRKMLEINPRDELEFFVEDESLVLKKVEHTCMFCALNRDLISYMGKHICGACVRKMHYKL